MFYRLWAHCFGFAAWMFWFYDSFSLFLCLFCAVFLGMDHDQRHFKMSFAAVKTKATDVSASCSLCLRQTQARHLFLSAFLFYLPAFSPALSSSSEALFAHSSECASTLHVFCLCTWHTFPLVSPEPQIPLSLSLTSPPPLFISVLFWAFLCSSVNYALHIKAPRSLSSVQDASAVMRKGVHNNSSSEHCLCIW